MIDAQIDYCPFNEIIPIEEIKLEEPNSANLIVAKHHTLSPLQALIMVYYAKVKINGEWQYRGIRNTWFGKQLTLLQVYELITSTAFKSETDTLQAIEDEKEAKKFKATYFNYACFSGTFRYRDQEGLLKHSRLICIDLDHLNSELSWVRETINKDPLTIMSFISPSGTGLKVVYQIDPEKHSQSLYYQYLSDYLSTLCCLPIKAIDEACKDVSRACLLPYDPSCFINLNLL